MNDSPLQILCVDDNATDALLLENILEEFFAVAFVLTHVTRLSTALRSLDERRFDVVLLDLGLPDSQGLETFTQMQRCHPEVPILVFSGLGDPNLAVRAVQEGAQDYLIKGSLDGGASARAIRYAIERKRSEQKLLTSERSYRRLFEAAQDGILILNAETGQITDANPFLEQLLGYTVTEFVGKSLWEICSFQDKADSRADFAILKEQGYIRYDDIPLATRDGRFVDVEFVSNLYNVGDKQVIQCNIRDISARKQAEAAVQKASDDLEQAHLETLHRLAMAAEYRDDSTGLHTRRVGVTAGRIAEALGLSPAQVDLILQAAPLHDVGKIGIADTILLKPGKLTEAEFATVKCHTAIGAKILSGSTSPLLQLAEEIALTHHERWDGTGYNGLEGEIIPLSGRIVAVADVFDALTHERPYKQAWSVSAAIAEIKAQIGRQFDACVVKAFMTLPHQELV